MMARAAEVLAVAKRFLAGQSPPGLEKKVKSPQITVSLPW